METSECQNPCIDRTAFHEAGHVVMNLHYLSVPEYATLEPHGEFQARVHSASITSSLLKEIVQSSSDFDWEPLVRRYAHSAYAGAAAEAIIDGDLLEAVFEELIITDLLGETDMSENSYFSRLEVCLNLMLELHGDADPEKWPFGKLSPYDILFEEIWDETIEILQQHWTDVTTIAEALIERRTLTGEELLAIYDECEVED